MLLAEPADKELRVAAGLKVLKVQEGLKGHKEVDQLV